MTVDWSALLGISLSLATATTALWTAPRCTPSSHGFYLAGTVLLAGCPR